MNGKRFSGENARRSGFYLALAVCLVAVGIAAWSTYDAVNSYTSRRKAPAPSWSEAQPGLCPSAGRRLSETDAHPEDGEGQQPSATPQAPSSAQEGSSHSAVNDDPEAPENTASAAQETAGQAGAGAHPATRRTAASRSRCPPPRPCMKSAPELIWPVEGGRGPQRLQRRGAGVLGDHEGLAHPHRAGHRRRK